MIQFVEKIYNILSMYVNFKRPKKTSSYQYLSLEGRIKSDLNFLLSTFVTTIRKKKKHVKIS